MTMYIQPNGTFGGPGKVKDYVTCVKPGQDARREATKSSCGSRRVTREGDQYVTEETCNGPGGPQTYRNVYAGDFKNTFQQEYYAGPAGGNLALVYRITQKRIGACH